jgi:DNA-directed RNA polymerase subunit RPC12/RpoP
MSPPLDFRCPNCQQRLTAKAEKVGRRVKCPRCGGALVVPGSGDAAAPPVSDPSRSAGSVSPEVETIELPVVIASDEPDYPARPNLAASEPFDPNWVAFPRRLLYVHAIVLGVTLAGVFALGYLVGRDQQRRPRSESSALATGPISVDGRVTYTNRSKEQVGDDGAVVIALPRDRRPSRTEKPSLAGLGPRDPPPPDNDPVLEAIAALGGAYVRTDPEGRFRLVLPTAGEYYVLYISRNAARGESAEIGREERAAMGEYFIGGLELIGRQQYAWSLRTLDADSDASHSFLQNAP